MNDGDGQILVSHAEFVARRHRRLRVIEEFHRLTDDHSNESDCQAHPLDLDLGEPECTPLRLRARRPVPLAFPKPR
jgi:hypothetical protein